ncbi:uncharacterized protein PAC_03020 [Phialocephala subalpina]|uniref:Uncharacterized protein n=1 Tax=Phialocephala subalpina TaxID=576137 RepID=A0A1L7WK38_9HELO|nr:uncharacterized protein PAC_03020 [Phialocephala subalpina]
MRLLNTSTGLSEEFIGTNMPAYANLSHTWGEEEVLFKDMTTEPSYGSRKGYAKISMTCQLAKADELQFAWIDTCCIDKTSSTELSEAINSMYQWYERAEKCYAYLVDIESTPAWRENLAHCRWLTRALEHTVSESEGIDILTSTTGIDRGILGDSRSLLSISVAQRMSWASRRVTTRVEDEAYCLLGIFEVNMPMLYGEGRKAFLRLQVKIVRICPDLSIFAWKASSPQAMDHEGPIACSIFASAAVHFAESGAFAAVNAHSTNDFFILNQGIKLHTLLAMLGIPKQQGYRYVFPVCKIDDGTILGIRLRKCGASQLVREDPWVLVVHDLSFPSMQSRPMYSLARLPPAHFPNHLLRDIVLHTRSRILQIVLSPEMVVNNVWPWSRWDVTDQIFFMSDNLGLDYAAATQRKSVAYSMLARATRESTLTLTSCSTAWAGRTLTPRNLFTPSFPGSLPMDLERLQRQIGAVRLYNLHGRG